MLGPNSFVIAVNIIVVAVVIMMIAYYKRVQRAKMLNRCRQDLLNTIDYLRDADKRGDTQGVDKFKKEILAITDIMRRL